MFKALYFIHHRKSVHNLATFGTRGKKSLSLNHKMLIKNNLPTKSPDGDNAWISGYYPETVIIRTLRFSVCNVDICRINRVLFSIEECRIFLPKLWFCINEQSIVTHFHQAILKIHIPSSIFSFSMKFNIVNFNVGW